MAGADASRPSETANEDAWTETLLDDKTLAIAERAAAAAGLSVEDWLDRAILRAATEAPPVRAAVIPQASPGQTERDDSTEDARRRPWRTAALLLPPLLLAGAIAALLHLPHGGEGVSVTLAPPPSVAVAIPAPGAAGGPEPSDPSQLALWLAPRAAKGDAEAEYRLGALYALGKGVQQDYARAAPLLRKAAESGIAEAQFDYGVLCEHGHGVPQDQVQAAAWYAKAAAQSYPDAALSLGYAYAKGMGVTKDMIKAAQWFRRAAELGVGNAQYNLAFLYEHGEGVPPSAEEAYAWYSLAAAHGDAGAKSAADHVAETLSARQVKDAEARAVELRKLIEHTH